MQSRSAPAAGRSRADRPAVVRSLCAPSRAGELAVDELDLPVDLRVFLAVAVDRADGVEHGRVIPPAEVAADFFEAVARVLARQEHADLPREGDALVPLLRLEVGEADVVVLRDRVED